MYEQRPTIIISCRLGRIGWSKYPRSTPLVGLVSYLSVKGLEWVSNPILKEAALGVLAVEYPASIDKHAPLPGCLY